MARNNKTVFKLDINNIADRMRVAQKKSNAAVVSQIIDDCGNYVPVDTGELINSARWASDYENGKVIWDTPYARQLYYGAEDGSFASGGRPLWFEEAKAVNRDKWVEIAEEIFSEGL